MFRRGGLVLAALALFSLAGGQWGVAQSVAWIGMLRDSVRQSGSFAQAISQTFDGQHPCELCKQIAFAKASEKRAPDPSQPEKGAKAGKNAPLLELGLFVLRPAVAGVSWIQMKSSAWSARAERPPTPPPRA